jgi:large subunit ribosomal protein L10
VNRDGKAALIEEITQDMGESHTMFVADYRGLDVPGISALRDRLREADASFRVVKNTLAKRALASAGIEGIDDLFAGPTAVAFVRGDAAAVAKALDSIAKQTSILEVRGGIMDGRRVEQEQVKEIASLPPREVILAMLLSAVNAPLTQMVGVASAPMRDIVMILDAYIEKRKEAGEAA